MLCNVYFNFSTSRIIFLTKHLMGSNKYNSDDQLLPSEWLVPTRT